MYIENKQENISQNESSHTHRSFYSYVNEFVIEAIQVAVILYVIYIFQEKELDFFNIFKTSLTISAIMMIVELYNNDMKKTIKMGIFGSIGGKMLR